GVLGHIAAGSRCGGRGGPGGRGAAPPHLGRGLARPGERLADHPPGLWGPGELWPPGAPGGGLRPRLVITGAVCQVRMIVSPIRPMAWESEPIMEIAPRSCSTSSAAIVVGRIRDSANARSSGIEEFRWWHTMSMSRCSSRVLRVYGRVGLVEDGSTLGGAAPLMMSGAWPPPAPSVWYVWIGRPPMASSV